MPKGIKKAYLPTKICIVCQREFTWRKKWEKNWEGVLYCSKACSAQSKNPKRHVKDN